MLFFSLFIGLIFRTPITHLLFGHICSAAKQLINEIVNSTTYLVVNLPGFTINDLVGKFSLLLIKLMQTNFQFSSKVFYAKQQAI